MGTVPDGQLCHITSSAKDCLHNIRIVKVSEDELLKSNEPPYKLILIGEENNACESLSEKSDEEIFETENLDIELKTKNFEKDKDVKTHEAAKEYKPPNQNFMKKPFNKKYRSNIMQRNRNNSSGIRNFNSSGNVKKNYNRSVANPSNIDIEPWLNPPHMLNSNTYGIYSHYSSVMEPHLNTSVNSNIDKSVGLLGDGPSDYQFRNFQSENQSNHYGHGENYWNNKYSKNYQSSSQVTSTSGQPNHENYYHQSKRWDNRSGKTSWKRKMNRNQRRRRRTNTGHFN